MKTYLPTLKTHVVNLKRDTKDLSRDLQRSEARGKLGSKTLLCLLYTQQEMSEMEESLEGLRKELEAVEREENKLRAQEVDIKHEVEKYETVLKENQQKVKHWQKEVYNAACEQALHLGELRVVTRERGKKPPLLVASRAKNGDPARRLYNEGSNP